MTCWLGSSPHSSQHPAKLVNLVPCESEDKIFLTCHVTTQLKCHVTFRMDFPHLTSSPYFGVHTLYENGNITFFICQVTTMSKCHVTLWVEFPHPKTLPC